MLKAPRDAAVLVVEDEPLIRFSAVDAVEDLGVLVLEAEDADEALQLLGDYPQVRVIFTDINMPGMMDGLQLASRVHELRPDVGIVVTSGKQFVEEARLPGHGSFLAKPYRPEQLKQLVSSKLR
jgi:CheY-like chemotaxis protein